MVLLLITFTGFVFVPSWNAGRDMIASSGTQILVLNNLSFIPFTLSHSSVVHGSLEANQKIGVYIVNSSIGDLNPYSPPSNYLYYSGPSSLISFNLSLGSGSYYLVFFGTNSGYSSKGATVTVTQSISFDPIAG